MYAERAEDEGLVCDNITSVKGNGKKGLPTISGLCCNRIRRRRICKWIRDTHGRQVKG